MPRYLFPIRVQVSAEQVFASFRRAAPTLSPAALLLVTAQTHGLEAGGGSSIRNFNLGGAKSRPGDGRDWTFFGTRDPAGPKPSAIVSHPAPSVGRQQVVRTADAWAPDATWSERMTCFRAFESLDAATADHMAMMEKNFPKSLALLQQPFTDPETFAHSLKSEGYFAAPVDNYPDPDKPGHMRQGYASALKMWVNRYSVAMPNWHADA